MTSTSVSRFSRLLRTVCKRKFYQPEIAGIQFKGHYGTSAAEKEYAFEDCNNFGAKKVCLMTDKHLVDLDCVKTVQQSLDDNKVNYKLYSNVRVEPTNESFQAAIDYAKEEQFDLYICVGGGSVIDTCKAANLYASNPSAELLDYVNAPIGKGLPVTHTLKPLIARISNRAIRPTLGIVDPLHLRTMPERVAAYSGIDVLCHGMSYPISGLVKNFKSKDYDDDHPMVHRVNKLSPRPQTEDDFAMLFENKRVMDLHKITEAKMIKEGSCTRYGWRSLENTIYFTKLLK
ncbi:ADHFE1 [Mytilus coruscus]|uniref:ADHFE1 n=1 Tax=Mytilus coruscus TaxID=42192 RepID=A0A6J8C0R2_MYTCO|nr:ADHFE1 [Mytilus coruscus]